MLPTIGTKTSGAFLVGVFLFGCGGASASTSPAPLEQEQQPPRQQQVVSVVITPTPPEGKVGGREVVIDASDAVRDWVTSEAFSSTGWEKNEDASPPRYVVSFRSREGEVTRYFLGTVKGEATKYRCFGLCARWWTAPSQGDGSQDPFRYRVLSDEVWHPLARQWYLSSK